MKRHLLAIALALCLCLGTVAFPPPVNAGQMPLTIDAVTLTIPEPVPGQMPSQASTASPHITPDTQWSVVWSGYWAGWEFDGAFAANRTYDCTIIVRADEGYAFSSAVRVTLNGIPYNGAIASDYSGLTLYYKFSTIPPAVPGHIHTAGAPITLAQPTCTTTGFRVTTCTQCDAEVSTEVLNAPGHTHDAPWTQGNIAPPPDCPPPEGQSPPMGLGLIQTCTRCDNIISRAAFPTQRGHEHIFAGARHLPIGGSWIQIKCSADQCDVVAEIELSPCLHTAGGNESVYLEPTTTHEGTRAIHCAECSRIIRTDSIPALTDYTTLQTEIAAAQALDNTTYTTDSRWILKQAIGEAVALTQQNNASDADIAAAITALRDAVAGMVLAPPSTPRPHRTPVYISTPQSPSSPTPHPTTTPETSDESPESKRAKWPLYVLGGGAALLFLLGDNVVAMIILSRRAKKEKQKTNPTE